jgi:hypothetical protein
VRVAKDALAPVVARYRCNASRIYFCADAAFTNSDVYRFFAAESAGLSNQRSFTGPSKK